MESDGDLEKRLGGFRLGRVAADGRRSNGVRQKREAAKRLAYFLRLESEFEKEERGFMPRRDFWPGMVAIFPSG